MAARRAASPLSRLLLLRNQSNSPIFSTGPSRTGTLCYMFGRIEHDSNYTFSRTEPVTYISPLHKRWASSAASGKPAVSDSKISIGPESQAMDNNEKETGVVYYGPISSTIKKVKLLSLSTCCLSVSLGPVITFMTSPDMNVIVKGAVASTVMILSASTTAALHWFVTPYIHKLRWQPGSDSFEVEMLSWLATHIPKTIKFADIRPAETNRPYVSFQAGNSYYFVDAEHCHNKALLQKLTPKKPLQSAFKNL